MMRKHRAGARWPGLALVALPGVAGCVPAVHAPTVPVLGTFFPIWLIAAVLGIIVTVAMRLVFIRTGIHDRLPVPLLVYLFSAVKFSVGIWALWVGEVALLDR
ncbi:MAG: YtcA family lipoprotein [Alkalilacustris sp.]